MQKKTLFRHLFLGTFELLLGMPGFVWLLMKWCPVLYTDIIYVDFISADGLGGWIKKRKLVTMFRAYAVRRVSDARISKMTKEKCHFCAKSYNSNSTLFNCVRPIVSCGGATDKLMVFSFSTFYIFGETWPSHFRVINELLNFETFIDLIQTFLIHFQTGHHSINSQTKPGTRNNNAKSLK